MVPLLFQQMFHIYILAQVPKKVKHRIRIRIRPRGPPGGWPPGYRAAGAAAGAAAYGIQQTVYSRRYAADGMQQTVCSRRYTAGRRAADRVRYAADGIQQAAGPHARRASCTARTHTAKAAYRQRLPYAPGKGCHMRAAGPPPGRRRAAAGPPMHGTQDALPAGTEPALL